MTEEKVKFQMRIDPDTDRKIKAAMPRANCRSQNEFMEKAVRFYCDYLAAEDVANFLPRIFVHAMRDTIKSSENRIARLLFKLTVEISMMMHVLALGLEINVNQLDDLRWQCVQEVKKLNGAITFKDTLEKNQGEE